MKSLLLAIVVVAAGCSAAPERNLASTPVVEPEQTVFEEPETVVLDDLLVITHFHKSGILISHAEPWPGVDVEQATKALRAYLEGDPLVTTSGHPLRGSIKSKWREREVWAGGYASLTDDHDFANFAWDNFETRDANIAGLLERTKE